MIPLTRRPAAVVPANEAEADDPARRALAEAHQLAEHLAAEHQARQSWAAEAAHAVAAERRADAECRAEAARAAEAAAELTRVAELLRAELAASGFATTATIDAARSRARAQVAQAAADLASVRQQADAERAAHTAHETTLRGEFAERHAAAMGEAGRQAAARAVAEAVIDRVLRERDALLASTAWRVTWPLRRLAGTMPHPVRWHGRRILKVAWWAATPWRIPPRIRALQERAAGTPPVLTTRSDPAPPPAPDARLPPEPPPPEPPPPEPPPANAQHHPPPLDPSPYARWIAEIEPALCAPIADAGERLSGEPRFSLLIASADQPAALAATLDALQIQANPGWEALVAAPEGPAGDAMRSTARSAALADSRIVAVPSPPEAATDKGAALAALLRAAKGAYIAVLDPGDALAPAALDEVAHALAHAPGAAVLYSDEDAISPAKTRENPALKPSWSPELLHAYNYFGRLTVLARDLALGAGGFTPGTGAAAEWDLNLRAADAADADARRIVRIPRVLCHRAPGDDRPAPATQAAAQHRAALRAYWTARGILDPRVETQPNGTQRSTWSLPDPPLVSVIIPSRNRHALLRRCIEGVLDRTDYRRVEVIVVDNRSDDPETLTLYAALRQRPNLRVVPFDRAFNYSAACNRGAAFAQGALLLFLNNDIEVTDPGWLGELVRAATLPGVGVAGLKLRYPTGELQHGGVVAGINFYGVMFRHASEGGWGVFGSPDHPRNWLAIMGTCQMVRREVFDAVGGFDEAYRIANSDVALSLRAHRAGWRTAYTPYAELTHHEGASRGRTNPLEDMVRAAAELRRLGFGDDPYFHPGLSALDPIPRLRAPGEPDTREKLARDIEHFLAAGDQPEAPLDCFDDWEVQCAAGLPRERILWPPQPATAVVDRWSAARWTIDLVRGRPDLRARFPRALTAGPDGRFAHWLQGEGGDLLGLPRAARPHLRALFADDPAAPARQLYFWRDDLRVAFPLGLLPPGRRGLAAWLLRHGHPSEGVRLEAAWWFILGCAENPAAELVRTYLFTPPWQEAHPYGLTVFGRDAFAAWVAARYRLPPEAAIWLDPAAWPVSLTPAEQVRLAYAARDEWRAAHPDAFGTERNAQAVLAWLASSDAGLPSETRAWCAARAADGTAAALATPGANLIASFCYPSGLRVSAEAMSSAMDLAGAPVSRRDMRTERGDDPHHAACAGLEIHDVTVIHTQPEPYFDTCYALADLAERTPRTYRIAYWYWELDSVPDWWAEKASGVDEVWAATAFVADALRQTLPVPVRTMFPGVRIGEFTRRPREAFGLPGGEGRFAFLFSFHMSSIMERKNPLALVRAFRSAFRPDEPVDLVLKTTSFGRQDVQVAQLRDAGAGANVHVLDRVLTPDETLSLTDACDCYVSLHHSEGLGLTMAEAMLLGKPCIATRYSGNLDFMDDGNSLLVDCDIVPLGRPVPPYGAAGQWAEPSVDHAARLMRRVFDDQAWAAGLGAKAQADARARLSLEVAGKRMAARLAEIKQDRRGGRVVTDGHPNCGWSPSRLPRRDPPATACCRPPSPPIRPADG